MTRLSLSRGMRHAMKRKEPFRCSLLRAVSLTYLVFGSAVVGVPYQETHSTPGVADHDIYGVVVESETGQPISGSTVSLFKNDGGLNGGSSRSTATTDLSGSFRFTSPGPGDYRVQALMSGYVASVALTVGSSDTANLVVSNDQPVAAVRLVLHRPAEISGRVADEATGDPIAKLDVGLWQVFYVSGIRRFIPLPKLTTSANGEFVATGLSPGDYVIGVGSHVAGKDRITTIVGGLSKDEVKLIDHDYEGVFWPSVSNIESATPVRVISHQSQDLGQFRLRKVPFYRAHIIIDAHRCSPSEDIDVTHDGDAGSIEFLGTVPCGNESLIKRFKAGSHRLWFYTGKDRLTRLRGSTEFQVVDENIKIFVQLNRGIDIEGIVIAADGASKPPFQSISLFLKPRKGVSWADEGPVAPYGDGKIRISNVELTDQSVSLSGLPDSRYVKEMRYNGAIIRHGIMQLSPGALAHHLEIVVDDKPATIAGTVTNGDAAAGAPFLLLLQRPFDWSVPPWSFSTTTAGQDGKYQFKGVAPGDYNLLAIPESSRARIEEPSVLQGLLTKAKEITLASGDNQTLSLELVEFQ